MSTVLTSKIISTSSADTERLAEQLATKLRGGEVIELVSDLGGGKTTFVRGLARGLGSLDKVASPTFTISREYQLSRPDSSITRLIHMDFYRLHDAGVVAEELAEFVGDPQVVIVVEWAEIVESVLPVEHLTVRLQVTGKDSRELSFEYPPTLQYLATDGT